MEKCGNSKAGNEYSCSYERRMISKMVSYNQAVMNRRFVSFLPIENESIGVRGCHDGGLEGWRVGEYTIEND